LGFEPTQHVMLLTDLSLELPDTSAAPNNAGLDLDNVCTCQPGDKPDPNSCSNPLAAVSLCDGPGGVDSQFRKILPAFGFQELFGDKSLKEGVRSGRIALLLQVIGYNGEDNDGRVRVDLANAQLQTAAPDAGKNDAGPATAPQPKFDESDPWLLDSTSVTITTGPQKVAVSAFFSTGYVVNRTLVAKEFQTPVRMVFRILESGGKIRSETIDIADAVLVGKLEPSGGSYTLTNGFIAGKWPIASSLRLAESLNGCKRDVVYDSIRSRFCSARDIATGTPVGQQKECDAISLTLGFSSTRARFVGSAPPPAGCQALPADTCSR
jgi:hypothetical protein